MEDIHVTKTLVEHEMKRAYLSYAMSVIVGRALPDVRDGLKPVHRRILYAMGDMGLVHNKPFKKSVRIVGEVLGKYHPHGDSAAYESLVRMTQDFSLRYPLIMGQGNFGSVDGDNAAAMRYTEAKLAKIADEMLDDIKKETVDFIPNFSAEFEEPLVLPARMPNLLINGSSGIAVGMATNIPPHNLNEVCTAAIKLIDTPDADVNAIAECIAGPDFPTGGEIIGTAGIMNYLRFGRGKVRVRAKYHSEEKKNRKLLIITEIPYQTDKSQLLEHIADLVREKIVQGVADIRDESDKSGMRIVFILKQDANEDVVINQLFKHSKLQTSFGVIMLSIVNNVPKVLNVKEMLEYYLTHRRDVVRRRTQFDLTKAEDRAHILEGLIKALNQIDAVIQKIKASRDGQAALAMLMHDFGLSEPQSKAILDMRLQKLASLEQEKIRTEHGDLLIIIKELKEILASQVRIDSIIKNELIELRGQYGDPRRTTIIAGGDEDEDLEDVENLIKEEDMVVTISHHGYIKRVPTSTYKQQGRGGKGILASGAKEDDFIEDIFVSSTHAYVLFFTDKGQVHWLKVYNIPEGTRQAKGKAIVNLLDLAEGEQVRTFIPVRHFDDTHFIILATHDGTVKKIALSEFSRPRKGGIRAITLNEGDDLIDVVLTDGSMDVMLATANGMAVRFNENALRPLGRTAAGVRGIRLKEKDIVIGMVVGDDQRTLLTITENGYGKRTIMSDYRLTNRGGSGVKNIICSERNGNAVAVKLVTDEDELMFASKNGILIRTAARSISTIGRNTQGVRLMKLESQDKVVSAATIINEDEKELPQSNAAGKNPSQKPATQPVPVDMLDDEAMDEPTEDPAEEEQSNTDDESN